MNRSLLWLAVGGFIGSNEGFLIGSLLPFMAADHGVTIGQAGIVVFAYSIAYGVGTPVMSALLGHVDKRRLLAGAELGVATFCLLIAVMPGFVGLLLARVGLAVVAGLFTANAFATAAALSPPDKRGAAMSFVASGQSLALIVGVPAGAWIAANFGWRTIYFAIAALAFSASIGFFLGLPKGLSGDRQKLLSRLSVLGEKGVPIALLGTTLFMLSAYLPIIYVAVLTEVLTSSLALLPVALLANGVGAVIGSNVGGRLADRIGPRKTLIVLCIGQVGTMALLAVGFVLQPAMATVLLCLVMALSGVLGWGFWAAQSTQLSAMAAKSVSLAISLNLTALNIGVAVTALVGGALVDRGGALYLPLLAAAIAVLATLAAFALPRPTVVGGTARISI
jgi:predicted MFS family arabinose efflux permease